MKKLFAGVVGLLALTAVASAQDDDYWDQATFETLDAIAVDVLNRAQALSFKNDLEYCGFIAFDDNKKLRASRPLAGEKDSCAPDAPETWELVASYHTHGTVDTSDPETPPSAFELPSGGDFRGDFDEGVDGYVATPGGRFWFIDTQVDSLDEVFAELIGGQGTLLVDPNYEPGEIDECNLTLISVYDTEDIEAGELTECELFDMLGEGQ